MIYLTDLDLHSGAFRQFFDQDPAPDKQDILDNIERQNISLIKTKLNGKYDTDAIFSASGNDRHWLIVKILSKLVIYDFFRRNAARKLPSDIREEYEWAMDILEKIKDGKEVPAGLPPATGDDGQPDNIMYGNRKNNSYYV